MLIAIIDYGMGNLRSVERAVLSQGYEAVITDRPEAVVSADKVILPGVGAFPDAMDNIENMGLGEAIRDTVKRDKPLLAVCLGMQLLFEKSFEIEERKGLGILHGEIRRLPGQVKIPHMGWNSLDMVSRCRLLDDVADGSYMYFVHSYYAAGIEDQILCATCDYRVKVPAVVSKGRVFGVQFHPEKSGDAGLGIYKSFGEMI
jgi:glutamine amidotransferase